MNISLVTGELKDDMWHRRHLGLVQDATEWSPERPANLTLPGWDLEVEGAV